MQRPRPSLRFATVLFVGAVQTIVLVNRVDAQVVPAPVQPHQPPPAVAGENTLAAAGFDESKLSPIHEIIQAGIADGKMPGCVVCFGRKGKVCYLESFGLRKTVDGQEPMTVDTVFDMASITKPVVTSTCVMQLLDQDRLTLDTHVEDIFPNFGCNGKETITVKHLLIHQSGLIPDNALGDYLEGPDVAWERICNLGTVAPVGEQFKYSDVNFIVLAKIVEKLSGKPIDQYANEHIFDRLNMQETGYNPAEALRGRAATTEKREGEWIRGEVHDPRAHALGGVAGHAGLFSTARDLATYASMMLGEGTLKLGDQPVQILSPESFRIMTSAYQVSRGTRGLGWDKQSPYSSNRGKNLSPTAFGHGGFTGTVLWIDPQLDLYFIFLSNRVHPNGQGSVNQLAGKIIDQVVASTNTPNNPGAPESLK